MSIVDEVGNFLSQQQKSAPTASKYRNMRWYASRVASDAVTDFADAQGSLTSAAGAAEGASLWQVLGVFGQFFFLYTLVEWVHSILLQIGQHLPAWLGIRALWELTVGVLIGDPGFLVADFTTESARQVPKAVAGHQQFLNYLIPYTTPYQNIQAAAGTGTVNLQPLYNELHADEGLLYTTIHRVDWIESNLNLPQPTVAPNLAPLQEQINALAQRLLQAETTITELHTAVNNWIGLQIQLVNDVAQLQSEIGQVRSTVTSWPEFQQTVGLQIGTLTNSLTQTQTAIQEQGDFLAELAPLAPLALAPAQGIRNLQKLQQDPCQCPQLPGLPGDMAGMLALYEFITHG